MKNVHVIGIIVIILAITAVVYVAMHNKTPSVDSSMIVENAIRKISNISQYDINYNMTNSLKISAEEITMSGIYHVLYKAPSEHITVNIHAAEDSQLEQSSFDMYSIPDGKFSCTTSLSGIACEHLNKTSQVQNPVDQIKYISELLSNGFASAHAQGTQTILGRTCDAVLVTYDIAAILANASLPAEYASGIKEISTAVCLDKDSGLPLEYKQSIIIEAEESAESDINMIATNLGFSVSDIELPKGAVIY